MKCTDCHDAHTTKLYHYDNQLCTRCHVADDKNPAGYDNPGTIFMKWAPREPVAWSVICHTKTIWLLMTEGITVFAFHARTFPPSLVSPMPAIIVTLINHSSGLPMLLIELRVLKGRRKHGTRKHFIVIVLVQRMRKKLLLDASQNTLAPAFTRSGALLALRSFISEASTEEALRQLDSNESIVRVAALSKLEGLPPAARFSKVGSFRRSSACCPYRSRSYS